MTQYILLVTDWLAPSLWPKFILLVTDWLAPFLCPNIFCLSPIGSLPVYDWIFDLSLIGSRPICMSEYIWLVTDLVASFFVCNVLITEWLGLFVCIIILFVTSFLTGSLCVWMFYLFTMGGVERMQTILNWTELNLIANVAMIGQVSMDLTVRNEWRICVTLSSVGTTARAAETPRTSGAHAQLGSAAPTARWTWTSVLRIPVSTACAWTETMATPATAGPVSLWHNRHPCHFL